jgi:hypothetical protein
MFSAPCVGFGFLVRLHFALRSFALCVYVRLHLVLLPAGGPFHPSLSVENIRLQRGTRDTPNSIRLSLWKISTYRERRKKRPASRKQNEVQLHIHGTEQGYATQSEAEPKIKNPHTGAKQALTTSVEGWARPRIGVLPEALWKICIHTHGVWGFLSVASGLGMQIEDLIRSTHDELDGQKASLALELSRSKVPNDAYMVTRQPYGHLSAMQHLGGTMGSSHLNIPQASYQPQPQFQSAPSFPNRGMGGMQHSAQEVDYASMAYGSQEIMPQTSAGGLMASVRKAPPKSLRQRSLAEQQQQQRGMVMHPQHQIVRGHRNLSPTPSGTGPAHMMTQYMQPGSQMHGGMYGYAAQHGQHGMLPGHEAPLLAAATGQFFAPVDASMRSSSKKPQARNGRVLTQADITSALVNKQAELLWPDDGLWYLIKITAVDLRDAKADIMYITGETENGLNLEEIAFREEMRIIPG